MKNEYSELFIEKLREAQPSLKLTFDDVEGVIELDGETFRLQGIERKEGVPKTDYALVVVCDNPFTDEDYRAVFCAGLTSYGTSGAAAWLFNDVLLTFGNRARKLTRKVGNATPSFVAVLEIDIVNRGVASIKERWVRNIAAKGHERSETEQPRNQMDDGVSTGCSLRPTDLAEVDIDSREATPDNDRDQVFILKTEQPRNQVDDGVSTGCSSRPIDLAEVDIDSREATPDSDRDQVFISYSHKDRKWLETLQTHLKPYIRNENTSVWADTQIKVGANWREDIEKALASAKVAVLMVSPDFLASDFITVHELRPLLEAIRKDHVKIAWIPVSASAFKKTEIVHYQPVHDPSQPLDSLTESQQHEAFVQICEKIIALYRT